MVSIIGISFNNLVIYSEIQIQVFWPLSERLEGLLNINLKDFDAPSSNNKTMVSMLSILNLQEKCAY